MWCFSCNITFDAHGGVSVRYVFIGSISVIQNRYSSTKNTAYTSFDIVGHLGETGQAATSKWVKRWLCDAADHAFCECSTNIGRTNAQIWILWWANIDLFSGSYRRVYDGLSSVWYVAVIFRFWWGPMTEPLVHSTNTHVMITDLTWSEKRVGVIVPVVFH